MNSFWRYSGGTAKFLFVDSRSSWFLILLLYSPSVKTLLICLITTTLFATLEYFGYTIPNALRKLKIIMFGKVKESVPTKRMSRPDR